jgi:hypothetical protein
MLAVAKAANTQAIAPTVSHSRAISSAGIVQPGNDLGVGVAPRDKRWLVSISGMTRGEIVTLSPAIGRTCGSQSAAVLPTYRQGCE